MISRRSSGRRLLNVHILKGRELHRCRFSGNDFSKEDIQTGSGGWGKGFKLGIVCPKLVSNKLILTSTKDINNNLSHLTSFKEVVDKLHVAHDWSKELIGKPQYV